MAKWHDRADIFLLVIFVLLWVGAKIHFFTRYRHLSPSTYAKEHWPFSAGMVTVLLLLWIVYRISHRSSRGRSD